MKVALCFIISYQHILNKEQLWIDWIKENQDIINVYFHYKDINKVQSQWIKQHSIPPKCIQPTSYYNVVPAYMSILSYAYHHDTNNVWFCLLTDSCVPIIRPQKFREFFFNYYQTSIIKCKPAYWDIRIHRRANLRLFKKEFWLANDPWFTLCRDHVNKCLLFLNYRNDTFQQINSGGLANESMFAIILQTFGELQQNNSKPFRLINESSSVSDWTRMSSPTSPYLFKEDIEENNIIICNLLKENKYAMFLRKVHPDFPDKAVKHIMTLDFGHTYDKPAPLNLYGFFQILFLLVGLFLITNSLTKMFMN